MIFLVFNSFQTVYTKLSLVLESMIKVKVITQEISIMNWYWSVYNLIMEIAPSISQNETRSTS